MSFFGVDSLPSPLESFAHELEALADKMRQYDLNSLAFLQPPRPADGTSALADSRFVRQLLARRRQREQLFGPDLFGEPAWDMLLDLFAAHKEQRQISISSLCIAAAVPPSTAQRWISFMVEQGTLIRSSDAQDGRRIWVALSPRALELMESLIASWMRA